MKLSFLALALLSIPVAVGCSQAVEDASTSDDALVAPAPVPSGTFNLYRTPHFVPSDGCALTTALELKDMNAELEERFSGTCLLELAVFPNTRSYRLHREGTECGSTTYTADYWKGVEHRSIKLVDHRARTCEGAVPAQIVLTETVDNELGPMEITLYSADAPAATEEVLEGKLTSVVAIGGESTGTAIATSEGLVELVLDDAARAQFVDGKKARVKGTPTTLTGVETGERPAFDVSSFLVCPNAGWINCMPGSPRPAVCAAENRSWVQANCDGVQFAD